MKPKVLHHEQGLIHWQRNLNNAFAYDLVPSPGVCTAALKAARRVNDYPTAVRVFEGAQQLSPIRDEKKAISLTFDCRNPSQS